MFTYRKKLFRFQRGIPKKVFELPLCWNGGFSCQRIGAIWTAKLILCGFLWMERSSQIFSAVVHSFSLIKSLFLRALYDWMFA